MADPEEKYDVKNQIVIGSGCMANVFKVKRKSDNTEFAMKVIEWEDLDLHESEKK